MIGRVGSSAAVFLVLVACQSPAPSTTEEQQKAQVEEAGQMLGHGILCSMEWNAENWQTGVDACTEIIEEPRLRDQWLAAYTKRALIYYQVGRNDDALADFNATLALPLQPPQMAIAYSNRGKYYSDQGDHTLASKDFRVALELDPENAMILNKYAWMLLVKGDYQSALPLAKKANKLAPEQVGFYDTRAHALMGLGRTEEAEAAFERASKLGGVQMVAKYQSALAEKGYEPGRTDGVLDEATRAALSACIRDNCRLMLD